MNPSVTNNQISLKQKEIYKLFFQGGLQKYFPRDESRVYLHNLFLDSLNFCVSDYTSAEPSQSEKECLRSFYTKNYQLLNANLQ
jgi:hypothetical protein